MKLRDKFPEIYHQLLPDLLSLDIPEEKFSDCNNCHLCASNKLSVSQSKCCTYHVILPNYMVGAILSDSAVMDSHTTIQQKIESKQSVSPYGIAGTSDILEYETRRQNRQHKNITFEDRARYTCPFLIKESCSIWKYRSELCITYFCNPVSGKKGTKFWDALYQFIRYIESQMAHYALVKLGYPVHLMNFTRLKHDSYNFYNEDGSFDQDGYDRLWVNYKEEELYKECYNIISNVTASQLKEILGHKGIWMQDKCRYLFNTARKHIIPDDLLFAKDNKVESLDESTFNITSPIGVSIKVSKILLFGLKSFDGTKTPQDILRSSNLIFPVNSRRLHRFIDAGILIKAPNS